MESERIIKKAKAKSGAYATRSSTITKAKVKSGPYATRSSTIKKEKVKSGPCATRSSIIEETSHLLPLNNIFTADICEIHVGQEPEKVVFYVHKAVLVGASPFFKAALNGDFIEATSKILLLPSEQAALFSKILTAIYGGGYMKILENIVCSPVGGTLLQVAGRPVFVELWLSLDRLQLNALKTELMSFLNVVDHSQFSACFSVEHMVHVYQNTLHKSSLRSLMFKVLLSAIIEDPTKLGKFQDRADEIPELGMELARSLAHMVNQKKKLRS